MMGGWSRPLLTSQLSAHVHAMIAGCSVNMIMWYTLDCVESRDIPGLCAIPGYPPGYMVLGSIPGYGGPPWCIWCILHRGRIRVQDTYTTQSPRCISPHRSAPSVQVVLHAPHATHPVTRICFNL
eukprot:2280587-Prymnesium_polylepis.1